MASASQASYARLRNAPNSRRVGDRRLVIGVRAVRKARYFQKGAHFRGAGVGVCVDGGEAGVYRGDAAVDSRPEGEIEFFQERLPALGIEEYLQVSARRPVKFLPRAVVRNAPEYGEVYQPLFEKVLHNRGRAFRAVYQRARQHRIEPSERGLFNPPAGARLKKRRAAYNLKV